MSIQLAVLFDAKELHHLARTHHSLRKVNIKHYLGHNSYAKLRTIHWILRYIPLWSTIQELLMPITSASLNVCVKELLSWPFQWQPKDEEKTRSKTRRAEIWIFMEYSLRLDTAMLLSWMALKASCLGINSKNCSTRTHRYSVQW